MFVLDLSKPFHKQVIDYAVGTVTGQYFAKIVAPLNDYVDNTPEYLDQGVTSGFDLLMRWIATMVYRAETRTPIIDVFGGANTGKSQFLSVMARMIPSRYVTQSGPLFMAESLGNKTLLTIDTEEFHMAKVGRLAWQYTAVKQLLAYSIGPDMLVYRRYRAPKKVVNTVHIITESSQSLLRSHDVRIIDSSKRIIPLEMYHDPENQDNPTFMFHLQEEVPEIIRALKYTDETSWPSY